MNLVVNGEPREIATGTLATQLIELLDLKPERVALEINGRIVRRAEWPSVELRNGDRVEIVHFVGGGSD